MDKKIAIFFAVAVLLFFVSLTDIEVFADESAAKLIGQSIITSCPYTINSPGTYVLGNDINSTGTCITVNANDVTLDCQGYAINGIDAADTYGVDNTGGFDNVMIKNCIITNFDGGIYFDNANYGSIANNTFNSNNNHGILLFHYSNSELTSNNVSSNNNHGIYLAYSSNNTITNNIANSNGNGITIRDSNNNTLTNNTFSSNNVGIDLEIGSSNSTLTNNSVSNNTYFGIHLRYGAGHTLTNNTITKKTDQYQQGLSIKGFSLAHFQHNIDTTNTINSLPVNYYDGLYRSCPNNTVQNLGSNWSWFGLVGGTNVSVTASNNLDHVLLAFTTSSTITGINVSYTYFGISLQKSSNNTVMNNNVSLCGTGIYLKYSSNNTITNNTANSNVGSGIYLAWGSNNTITNNTASSNKMSGIQLGYFADNSILINNTASSNRYYGIYLRRSSNSIVTGNTANNNTPYGIHLDENSNYNTITNNNANSNVEVGIYLDSSSNNTITNNSVNSNNNIGIYLAPSYWGLSSNNTLTNNTVNNNGYGIVLENSNNNLIYNNYFNNTINAWDNQTNYWNTTKTLGTNIIGGPYIGGNYWHDYTGVDTDGDEIGDTDLPYNSSGNIASGGDYLPLTSVQDITPPIITILSPQNTTYNTTSVPLTFTVNEPTSWIGYSLDDQPNVTITGNTTLTLAEGSHNVIVYANDSAGNMGSSDKIYFTVSVPLIPIDSCGTLSMPGETYVLTQDLINFSGASCFKIAANGITLDCAGHTISGRDPPAGAAEGILLGHPGLGTGVQNVKVKNCNVQNVNYGIAVWYSSNNALINNTVSSNRYDGIRISYGSNNVLTNNTASSNRYYGISIQVGSKNILINNTITKEPGQGGLRISGKFVSYYQNSIDTTNTINGLPINYYDGLYRPCPDNTVQNLGSNWSWFGLAGCTNVSVTASNNLDHVLLAFTTKSNITGINASILLYSSNYNTLTSNIANSNPGAGIALMYSSYNILTNNIANSNSGSGFWITGSSSNILTNNIANSNSGYRGGIAIYHGSNSNILINNIANSNSGQGGIYLWASYSNNITNSIFSSNAQAGVHSHYSYNTLFAGNNVYGNPYGFYLSSSNTSRIYHNNIYSNSVYNVYSNQPIELSYNGEGNWWGRITSPCFCEYGNPACTTYDSNRADVIDSYPYCSYNGWLVIDSDGDGIPDEEDNCPYDYNPDQNDTDADGVGDACDACPYDPENDADADGVCGDIDNCPYVSNPDQIDVKPAGGDGVGDACQQDFDGDGINDNEDNCPETPNPDQNDTDGDLRGDACDLCPNDPADACASGELLCNSTNGCFVENGVGTASVDIPANTLPQDTNISILGETNISNYAIGRSPDNLEIGYIYTFEPVGINFTENVTITLKYEQGNMPEGKGVEQNLDIYFYDPSLGWVAQNAEQNMTNFISDDKEYGGTLALQIDHFSTYSIIAIRDSDGDDIVNTEDNCPYVHNPEQNDSDVDGIGDACDNCWYVGNPDQNDTDGNCPEPPYLEDPMCGDACQVNNPPYEPSNPSPGSGAINVDVNHVLGWTGDDPDGDEVAYDVYLGTDDDPDLNETDWPDDFYDPGTLDYDTTYFWEIIARDEFGAEIEGPLWNFTTIADTGFILNLIDFPMYEAESPYNEMCGAAVAQMALNYMWWNSSEDTLPPITYEQQYLYDYGINQSTDPVFIDTRRMRSTIQDLKPEPYNEYGYNFGIRHSTDTSYMLKHISQWVAYTIGTYGGHAEGHPYHVPTLVPAYGNYSNWMAIRGVHTNVDPYPLGPVLNVSGFWVNDPYPASLEGIGENSYKTAYQWLDTYYDPLESDDIYDGEYVAITEPPKTDVDTIVIISRPVARFTDEAVELIREVRSLDETTEASGAETEMLGARSAEAETLETWDAIIEEANDWIIQAAIDGANEELAPYDESFAETFENVNPEEPFFVNNYKGDDYYIVPFGNKEGTLVVILIDADDGSFKEASWVGEAVENYLPVTEEDAERLVRQYLRRRGVKDIRELTTELVRRDSTPYYPVYRIEVLYSGGLRAREAKVVFIVGQDGTVTPLNPLIRIAKPEMMKVM